MRLSVRVARHGEACREHTVCGGRHHCDEVVHAVPLLVYRYEEERREHTVCGGGHERRRVVRVRLQAPHPARVPGQPRQHLLALDVPLPHLHSTAMVCWSGTLWAPHVIAAERAPEAVSHI